MHAEQKKTANLTRIQALSKVSIALSETLSLDKLLYKAVTQCIETLKFLLLRWFIFWIPPGIILSPSISMAFLLNR